MRALLAIALSAALAGGVAACGEKDEPEPVPPTASGTTGQTGPGEADGAGKDEPGDGKGESRPTPKQQVTGAVRTVIGGGAPSAVCEKLVTQRYVQQAYGDAQGCRAAVAAQGVVAVEVSAVEITGTSATARAVPRGGPNKGETIKVKLVEEGNSWKVDSALSNAPAGP